MLFILIGITALVSFSAFSNRETFEKLLFSTSDIIQNKEYYRFFTSGFLHADMMHLGLNMYTLYIFGDAVIRTIGGAQFLILYFISMLGGGLLSLLINKGNPNYRAVGASGAVSGIIYAFIMFYPETKLYLFFALPIPGYIFGVLYILYSMFAMRQQADNIGHEAHLGGAIVGGVLTILLYFRYIPNINLSYIVLAVTLVALFLLVKRPDLLEK